MILKLIDDARGESIGGYTLLTAIVASMAMVTAPLLGGGVNDSVAERSGAEAEPERVVRGSSSERSGEYNAELGAQPTTFAAASTSSPYQGNSAEDSAPGYAESGSPWKRVGKGVLIVGVALAVTAVLVIAAPVSIPMAIALGGATLIAASSLTELGECMFGKGACADALIAPKAGLELLSYPILHPKETAKALAKMGNDIVVQPVWQCSGLGSGSCAKAMANAGATGGQIVTGLKDAAHTAANCGSSGDAKACGETGASVLAAFGIPAGGNLVRSRVAAKLAERGVSERRVKFIAPNSRRPTHKLKAKNNIVDAGFVQSKHIDRVLADAKTVVQADEVLQFRTNSITPTNLADKVGRKGFNTTIQDLGGGNYRVTAMPFSAQVTPLAEHHLGRLTKRDLTTSLERNGHFVDSGAPGSRLVRFDTTVAPEDFVWSAELAKLNNVHGTYNKKTETWSVVAAAGNRKNHRLDLGSEPPLSFRESASMLPRDLVVTYRDPYPIPPGVVMRDMDRLGIRGQAFFVRADGGRGGYDPAADGHWEVSGVPKQPPPSNHPFLITTLKPNK